MTMGNNPMEMMQQFAGYLSNYNGNNPQQEAMQMIQSANLNQRQLNKLQNTANAIYGLAQKMGILK